jgi:hypothetical protein
MAPHDMPDLASSLAISKDFRQTYRAAISLPSATGLTRLHHPWVAVDAGGVLSEKPSASAAVIDPRIQPLVQLGLIERLEHSPTAGIPLGAAMQTGSSLPTYLRRSGTVFEWRKRRNLIVG